MDCSVLGSTLGSPYFAKLPKNPSMYAGTGWHCMGTVHCSGCGATVLPIYLVVVSREKGSILPEKTLCDEFPYFVVSKNQKVYACVSPVCSTIRRTSAVAVPGANTCAEHPGAH